MISYNLVMRSDKKTSVASVVKVALLNPLDSQRDIAEKAGVWLWTANRVLQEVEHTGTKDERIVWITNTDLSIVTLGQSEIDRRLKDKEELWKMRTVEISQVIKESTARYSLFKWDATDENGWLKNVQTIDIL